VNTRAEIHFCFQIISDKPGDVWHHFVTQSTLHYARTKLAKPRLLSVLSCAMFTRMPVRAWDMVCISEISDRLYTFIHTEDADGFDDVAYRLVLCEVGQHTACARP